MNYHDHKTAPTRYYFVLSNNFLLAAKSIDSTKLSIVIPVEGKTIVMDEGGGSGGGGEDGDDTTMTPTDGAGCRFIIGGKKKTFHFETASRDETQKWIAVIEKACRLKVTDVYRLAYEIGSGSCGTSVIAAEHRSTRKRVAIKVINKKKIKDRQRLSHEITIMKKLRHQPCIVELYDIYESKKHLYLVMELCEGGDLLTTFASQAHSEPITCHVMHQIARAVNHMHKKGIVHRDLKPENVLCCKKDSVERIKVADFGISKHMDGSASTFSTPVGTLTYTAPELLNGELYGKEVDYWALGVIMHIMLCGYSPWSHCASEMETKRAIVDQDVELEDEDWMHVSQVVRDLILRLLHRNPRKRATNDDVLRITWEENKDQTSWRKARTKLRKTIRGDRLRQCSTGTVEANIHLMKRVYASDKYKKQPKQQYQPPPRSPTPPYMNGMNGYHHHHQQQQQQKQPQHVQHPPPQQLHHQRPSAAPHSAQCGGNNSSDDGKEDRYLSPPPQHHLHSGQNHQSKACRKTKKTHGNPSSNLSQSATMSTDEESDNFSSNQSTLNKKEIKVKRRKKSNHSSEPLNRNDFLTKFDRRRSRDDSELGYERMELAAKAIELYIEKKNREKQNCNSDTDCDSDVFPSAKEMGFQLF